jgi:hypothetical protein
VPARQRGIGEQDFSLAITAQDELLGGIERGSKQACIERRDFGLG